MKPAELPRVIAQGESATLEFKRSTGELREGMEALCGMLNDAGRGRVLFGITDAGVILGQTVAEKTLREVANASRKIEPAAECRTSWVPIRRGLGVLVVVANSTAPGQFTFEGRGFLRVGNTTQRMSRAEFEEIAGAFVVRFRSAAATAGAPATDELPERAKKIHEILGQLGPLRAPALLEALGEPITLRALQIQLKRLREAGHISALGRGKATTYRLTGEGRR